jgi:hypothetical protein
MSSTPTPEMLAADPTTVPAWARGADAVQAERTDYEVWELYRDGRIIGYMYDDGAGYDYAEGEHNIPAFHVCGEGTAMREEPEWEIETVEFRATAWMLSRRGDQWIQYSQCEELVEGRWEPFISIRPLARSLLGKASDYGIEAVGAHREAGDWFAFSPPDVHPDATDEELARWAAELEEDAAGDGMTVGGIEDYLLELRQIAREQVLEASEMELEE